MQNSLELTEMSHSLYAEVNGVRVHYHDVGQGPALVMIHGSGPGATGWANYSENMHVLAEHFRVICLDLPGFGRSGAKPKGSAMPGWYAETVRCLLDFLAIEKACFIGNSFGGAVSLKLALEHPKYVDRLVLMGSAGSMPVFSVAPTEAVKELLYFYDGEGPSLERMHRFGQHFVYDPNRISSCMWERRLETALTPEIMANPPMRPDPSAPREELWRDARLTKLPHEVLIIWGREDKVMPLDMAFPLLKQIPRARLLVMPQCGHWVQWEHAQEFNETVTHFLMRSI